MAKKLRVVVTRFIELDAEDIENVANYLGIENNIEVVEKYLTREDNTVYAQDIVEDALDAGFNFLDLETEVVDA